MRSVTRASRFLSAWGSPAGFFAPFEQPGHALKLPPGPRGRQLPAALRSGVDDVAPCFGGLSQPPLPFQQEGARIDRAEFLGIELMRAPPVGERAVRIAPVGPDLAQPTGKVLAMGQAVDHQRALADATRPGGYAERPAPRTGATRRGPRPPGSLVWGGDTKWPAGRTPVGADCARSGHPRVAEVREPGTQTTPAGATTAAQRYLLSAR